MPKGDIKKKFKNIKEKFKVEPIFGLVLLVALVAVGATFLIGAGPSDTPQLAMPAPLSPSDSPAPVQNQTAPSVTPASDELESGLVYDIVEQPASNAQTAQTGTQTTQTDSSDDSVDSGDISDVGDDSGFDEPTPGDDGSGGNSFPDDSGSDVTDDSGSYIPDDSGSDVSDDSNVTNPDDDGSTGTDEPTDGNVTDDSGSDVPVDDGSMDDQSGSDDEIPDDWEVVDVEDVPDDLVEGMPAENTSADLLADENYDLGEISIDEILDLPVAGVVLDPVTSYTVGQYFADYSEANNQGIFSIAEILSMPVCQTVMIKGKYYGIDYSPDYLVGSYFFDWSQLQAELNDPANHDYID